MAPDDTGTDDRTELSRQTLTDRIAEVEAGAEVVFNDQEQPYEVVATDRYSVTLAKPDGTRVTVSQNLQSGEWNVHEPVWWLDTVESNE